jgi:HEAT repeat protein
MAKYDAVRDRTGWGMPGPGDIKRSDSQVDELVGLTYDQDPKVRKVALTNLCPCHVRAEFPDAWDRILEMVGDPDPLVRSAVVHMLADGSPRHRQAEVVTVLESLRNDPDRKVRRQVNYVLGKYRRTGRVNVL